MAISAEIENSQIPLSVKVSPWSGVVYNLKKNIREFRYTPFVQVISHILFWVNGGIIAATYFVLLKYHDLLSVGKGVLIVPAGKSSIPLFVASSVKNLSLAPYLFYGMLALWLLFSLVSMVAYSFGKNNMTGYLLAISSLLLLLMAKVLLVPVLLFGG